MTQLPSRHALSSQAAYARTLALVAGREQQAKGKAKVPVRDQSSEDEA